MGASEDDSASIRRRGPSPRAERLWSGERLGGAVLPTIRLSPALARRAVAEDNCRFGCSNVSGRIVHRGLASRSWVSARSYSRILKCQTKRVVLFPFARRKAVATRYAPCSLLLIGGT